MSLYGANSSRFPGPTRKTEFDVLKASHKFLRDDDEDRGEGASWEDRVARKYYEGLYREFAVCDLKHFKSGNFALRWRTESEVISGAGESTCGNTRCDFHQPLGTSSSSRNVRIPSLRTVELPFAYEEHGEQRDALVKVVLCKGCLKKLMYKHGREKGKLRELEKNEDQEGDDGENDQIRNVSRREEEEGRIRRRRARSGDEDRHERDSRRIGDAPVKLEDEERWVGRRSARSASPSTSRTNRTHTHLHL